MKTNDMAQNTSTYDKIGNAVWLFAADGKGAYIMGENGEMILRKKEM